MTAGRGHVRTRSTPAHPQKAMVTPLARLVPIFHMCLQICLASAIDLEAAGTHVSRRVESPLELKLAVNRRSSACASSRPVTRSRSPPRKCAIGDGSDVLEAERDSDAFVLLKHNRPLFRVRVHELSAGGGTCMRTRRGNARGCSWASDTRPRVTGLFCLGSGSSAHLHKCFHAPRPC